ncbi:MAG: cytochrome c oxidase subunit 3 family protein [Planctomycetes bacterium]|nr:cytochrome c oxidase subunit 3 family protein [Planctomycetota bacterium]MCB9910574.1 cytochrome c oxidase subunit 3 family protein [Planctomycetota bacterium]MCB9913211.1 cytochrome c oxidase subunit 3 family protein [Planctomycetota bacterium]HRV81772.1 cytochrome c oxidase subunit 3 family protein [Planctomycetota bacterium]
MSAEAHAHAEHEHVHGLAHHFENHEQQFDSGKLGIWIFLFTEIMFFSGLFVAYTVYRSMRPDIFQNAAQYLDTTMGAINTGVLLLSSLTAAWGVRCAQLGNKKGLILNLCITILCAFGFMFIKYLEYSHKFHVGLLPGRWFVEEAGRPDGLKTFFSIYFVMTGLHGIHVLAGIVVFVWLLRRAIRGDFTPEYYGPVDFAALYWHLVDLIWIYLFPLLYLIN